MSLEVTPQGDKQILVNRYFAAPPAAVYTAHTDPDLLAKWMLGPPGWVLNVQSYDATPGGKIHLIWQHEGEKDLVMVGEFIELDPPHRTVHTETFLMADDMPPSTVTTRFDAEGEGCRLQITIELGSAEARDAMIEGGMAEGMGASYDRLAGLL